MELLPGSDLTRAFSKILIGTAKGAKFAARLGYGAYMTSRQKDEHKRLQMQAIVDELDELQRQAKKGNIDAQYQYGLQLCLYGDEYCFKEDINEGLRWLIKASENGHLEAKKCLNSFNG